METASPPRGGTRTRRRTTTRATATSPRPRAAFASLRIAGANDFGERVAARCAASFGERHLRIVSDWETRLRLAGARLILGGRAHLERFASPPESPPSSECRNLCRKQAAACRERPTSTCVTTSSHGSSASARTISSSTRSGAAPRAHFREIFSHWERVPRKRYGG